jgi:predicted amidohydrolase YtcJ
MTQRSAAIILRGARIGDRLVDVRIEEGLIAEIGAITDARGELVELDGRWLVPGLWDNHVHFTQWALQSQRLDVSSARSAAETAKIIAAAIRPDSPSPFVAVGFRDGLWPDAPNREVLDAVSAEPIVVVSGDLHAVWLNSAALTQYFDGHGGHSESDAGLIRETGLIREDDAFRILGLIDSLPDAQLDGWVDAAARAAAARGVVGIVDYEMDWNLETWTRRQAAGTNSFRVEIGVYTEHLERAIDQGLRTGDWLGELLTMGNFKILIDGSLNTRTAYCWDEYAGAPGEFGMLTVPEDRLVELVRRASAAGIEPAVHAIGDRANTIALDAFEAVGCRGRIEHAQFLRAADVPRFAALGIAASLQPDHAMDDRDVADRYWAGRTDRAFPLRSLVDAGATVLLGSDAPVSSLDPWVTLAAAVGRTRDGREPWHPEQAISATEAFAASTRSTVDVGQLADLVVIERDPLESTTDELREMTVFATLLGGRTTYGDMP